MSVSIRSILWLCVVIFGLNVYLYLQQSELSSVVEKQAVQKTYGSEQNGNLEYQDESMQQGVYRSAD